jgi:hypothetical protein
MINPPVCSKSLQFIVMGDPALTCLGINISMVTRHGMSPIQLLAFKLLAFLFADVLKV